MGACGSCTLVFFILCNVIIALIGVPLVVFGALSFIWRDWFWQHVDHLTDHSDDHQDLLRKQWENIGIVLIVVGGVCIIASFIGCAAASLRRRGLLGCYLVILFAVFGVSLAFGIIIVYAWIREADTSTVLEKFQKFEFYNDGNLTQIGLDWNDRQTKYKCCGLYGPDDYKDSKLKGTNLPILPSCCDLDWPSYNLSLSEILAEKDAAWTQCKDELTAEKDSERNILFTKGCLMPKLVIIIFGMLFGFAGIMFFTFLVGMCFCCCIHRDDDIIV